MIYRILVDRHTEEWDDVIQEWVPLVTLKGAGQCWSLSEVMISYGLPGPRDKISNRRVRFYFTELGWRKVGRRVAAAAKAVGYVIKVVRRKNPASSQVVYRDELQLAVLPLKSAKRGHTCARNAEAMRRDFETE